MLVFPAIDIRGGRCVRLFQGEYSKETVYGDPVEMTKRFLDEGATHLHVVDLDGAKTGNAENLHAIERIASLGTFVQTGGGIRTREDITRRMECGVSRCIIGTAAVENPDLLCWAVERFNKAISVGIDSRDGYVAVRGWVEKSDLTPITLGHRIKALGIDTAVFTQIDKDGTQMGPDLETSKKLQVATGLKVIASGGVGNIADIHAVCDAGLYGVIIGKALYEGKITIKQAMQFCNDEVWHENA